MNLFTKKWEGFLKCELMLWTNLVNCQILKLFIIQCANHYCLIRGNTEFSRVFVLQLKCHNLHTLLTLVTQHQQHHDPVISNSHYSQKLTFFVFLMRENFIGKQEPEYFMCYYKNKTTILRKTQHCRMQMWQPNQINQETEHTNNIKQHNSKSGPS